MYGSHMWDDRIVSSSCTFAVMPFASGLKPLLIAYKTARMLGATATGDFNAFKAHCTSCLSIFCSLFFYKAATTKKSGCITSNIK